jgi:aminoglycoside phosphotransferase (APT) family kinase protein
MIKCDGLFHITMAFYEESNPCDVDLEKLVDALKPDFHNVKVKDLKFFYHGTYNVFEFKRYILRVPDKDLRNSVGVKVLQNEVVKLKNLAKFLTVPIPQPMKTSLDEKMPYMLYKKLPGVSLSRVFHSLSPQNKKSIANGVTSFLNQLHAPRTLHQVHSKVFQTNFSSADYKIFWKNRFEEIKEKVFPLIDTSQKAWVYNVFSAFLRNPENFRFKPALSHCDFDITNILVHPQRGNITGIIDFEETKSWDPAADLCIFFENPSFQKDILKNYQFKDSISLQNRMKFLYCRTFAPYITWGLDHKKDTMIEYGLRKLEQIMKEFP